MRELPPLLRDQRKIDADHLQLLAIFHFVGAGFAVVGLLFLFAHYAFMNFFFANPKLWEGQKGGPPPAEFLAIFKWFYWVFAAWFAASLVLNAKTFLAACCGVSQVRLGRCPASPVPTGLCKPRVESSGLAPGSSAGERAAFNLISGLSLRARKRRTFSLVVAAVNCLHMPVGTTLGVFTFVVLLRDSVRELYEA